MVFVRPLVHVPPTHIWQMAGGVLHAAGCASAKFAASVAPASMSVDRFNGPFCQFNVVFSSAQNRVCGTGRLTRVVNRSTMGESIYDIKLTEVGCGDEKGKKGI